jgi:hypothetical protein
MLGVSAQYLDEIIRYSGDHIDSHGGGDFFSADLNREKMDYLKLLPNATNRFGPNLTGEWIGTMTTPNGQDLPIRFNLKFKENILLGTVTTTQGEGLIANGKIDGDKFTFDLNQGGSTISQQGIFENNSLSVRFNLGNNSPVINVSLKRKQWFGAF